MTSMLLDGESKTYPQPNFTNRYNVSDVFALNECSLWHFSACQFRRLHLPAAKRHQPQQAPQPQQPASQQTGQPDQTAQGQQVVQPQTKRPPEEPYIIEDGGLSIEPIYWFNRAQPTLNGGATTTGFSNLSYPGHANRGLGGVLTIPAGRSNSLRFSYFRIQGNANTTETQNVTIFGEGFSPGDYLAARYTLQNAKISWDYLSYTWYKPSGKIRLKTLYEVQYTNIATTAFAPLKPQTTDASGNIDTNSTSGSKNLIYPSLGVEFEQAIGRHFRWEAKGSGFGLPHRADIWDAEVSIAIRVRQIEILGGEKAFHFKTSPKGDQYFVDTLSGPYVGVRYYWGRQQ